MFPIAGGYGPTHRSAVLGRPRSLAAGLGRRNGPSAQITQFGSEQPVSLPYHRARAQWGNCCECFSWDE
jgi:hypothetical protein